MSSKQVTRYSPLSKTFHWVIAFVIIGMLSVGFFLDDIPDQFQSTAYMLHKSIGLTILLLMLLRFILIQIKGKPPLPNTVHHWEKIVSRFVQYSFYLLLILMPFSGWIMSVAADRTPVFFGLFRVPLPGISPNKSLAEFMVESHEIIAWIITALITLHIAGALKHHFIDKDNVLRSMLPSKQK